MKFISENLKYSFYSTITDYINSKSIFNNDIKLITPFLSYISPLHLSYTYQTLPSYNKFLPHIIVIHYITRMNDLSFSPFTPYYIHNYYDLNQNIFKTTSYYKNMKEYHISYDEWKMDHNVVSLNRYHKLNHLSNISHVLI